MYIRILFILLGVGLSLTSYSQESSESFDCVYYLTDGSVYRGTHIGESTESAQLLLVTGDTISIPLKLVKQRYKAGDFLSYEKGRFHYKTGSYLDVTQGFGVSQDGLLTLLDLSYNRRVSKNLNLGLGFGSQRNWSFLDFATSNGRRFFVDITHVSLPVFVQGKYFLNHKSRSFYVHSRLGYTIGRRANFNNAESNNGFMAAYGVGFLRATKHRIKLFVQMSQTHNYASGSSFAWGDGGQSVFQYNLWLNRVSLTWGIQYNLTGKRSKF